MEEEEIEWNRWKKAAQWTELQRRQAGGRSKRKPEELKKKRTK